MASDEEIMKKGLDLSRAMSKTDISREAVKLSRPIDKDVAPGEKRALIEEGERNREEIGDPEKRELKRQRHEMFSTLPDEKDLIKEVERKMLENAVLKGQSNAELDNISSQQPSVVTPSSVYSNKKDVTESLSKPEQRVKELAERFNATRETLGKFTKQIINENTQNKKNRS